MKILLTGANGQVGQELVPLLDAMGTLTATTREDLDLEDENAIRTFVRRTQPDLIVNAAAWTAVDLAEDEPDRADAVNHRAPAVLAEEARGLNAALVHFSTDYVFDGKKKGPWSEDDVPAPLNVYGRTKLAGEEAIRTADVPHLILRLSWVYGRCGRNFLNTMMRLLGERNEVAVVDDQYGCPTWSRAIAAATAHVIRTALESGEPPGPALTAAGGTFHMTGPGQASWYDFATAIRRHLVARGMTAGEVRRIPTAEYPTAAVRPQNGLLKSERLLDRFGVELPRWEVQLGACMADG